MAESKKKIIGSSDRAVEKYDPEAEMKAAQEKLAAMSEMRAIEKAKNCFNNAYQARRRYDWEWLARDLFRRGYQFSRYNAETKTLIMSSSKVTRIPVNLTGSAMRSIRNQVTTFRPKWEVSPDTQADTTEDIPYLQKFLDNVWRIQRLKKKVKELVTQGLITSVGGPFQIGWDDTIENEDGTKGNIFIYLLDPFDFFIDPKCTDGLLFSDAEYVIKAVRTPVDEVKNNPLYENTNLLSGGEQKLAASEYKQFLLQSLKFINQTDLEENQTLILKEGYFKERKNGKIKIRVLHWTDLSTKPLYETYLDTDEFPFVGYQADMNPLEVYGEGWARHAIAMNKVINALESSIFDYNYRYAKGRLVIDKNAGVRSVTNEHGSIIEKNRGSEVTSLPLQPLPSAPESQLQRFRSYFEDISGVHEASLGRLPTGIKSGIGIAELKQSDATNQDDLVDNLEDTLVEVARKIMKVASENFKTPRIIKPLGEQNGKDFAIVGQEFTKKNEYKVGKKVYKLAKLYSVNDINVTIGSWLAYTKEQKQNELKELFKLGVIDQQTLLENLEFGDINAILERSRREKMISAKRGQPQQGPTAQPTDEEIAMSENEMMLEGRTDVVPKPEDDHELHIAVHQEALAQGDNPIVDKHIAEHQAMLEQMQGIPTEQSQTGPMPEAQPGQQPEGGETVAPPNIAGILAQMGGSGAAPAGPEAGAGGGQPLPVQQ